MVKQCKINIPLHSANVKEHLGEATIELEQIKTLETLNPELILGPITKNPAPTPDLVFDGFCDKWEISNEESYKV